MPSPRLSNRLQDRGPPVAEPPGEPGERGSPGPALDERGLRTALLTLLGRPPFGPERERWLGRAMVELLDDLLGSAEAWRHWYDEQLYYFLLVDNFRPATEMAQAIPAELAAGRLDVREALHRIALSPSFELRNPGADTFVTVVMEQFVGLSVQKSQRDLEMGKSVYEGHPGAFLGASGESQADVVRIALESREASKHFLAREHQRLFFAAPEAKALQGWTRRFHEDPRTYVAIVREWFTSERWDERLARPEPLSNRLFVRALFVDLQERQPEPQEAESIRSALDGLADSRPLRAVLARMMLDSGAVGLPDKASISDPGAWIEALFRRLLGRGASPAELPTYVEGFHDEACRPETILLALLSDPDYHRY